MKYVHGYSNKEALRLADQADTLTEILHSDTVYPPGSKVLEAGCGVVLKQLHWLKTVPKLK